MNLFNDFCKRFPFSETTKLEQAIAFIWFHANLTENHEVDFSRILDYFSDACLPKPNTSRLRKDLTKSKAVHRGSKSDVYRLNRPTREQLDAEYGEIFASNIITTVDKAHVESTPFLSNDEIESAHKMAELYIILHCYENSARRLVENVLSTKLGGNWWDIAANAPMKRRILQRKENESKYSWISPRSSGTELYYTDWNDLLTLIRKYENDFLPYIKDMKFVILRFEELERVRNIIAHNGVLPSSDDFDRVILSFRDWCKQIST